MNEWKVLMEIPDDVCLNRHYWGGNFRCSKNKKGCAFENCPIRVQPDEPITAEWLVERGATVEEREHLYYDKAFKYALPLLQESLLIVVFDWYKVGEFRTGYYTGFWSWFPHIKTRQQFADLYRLLSGKELGQ